jgi:Ca2+-binding RTX toxin-like protein
MEKSIISSELSLPLNNTTLAIPQETDDLPSLSKLSPPPIIGTPENDIISTTSGDDRVFALDGNDVIIGSKGNDSINGGAGSDTMNYKQMVQSG